MEKETNMSECIMSALASMSITISAVGKKDDTLYIPPRAGFTMYFRVRDAADILREKMRFVSYEDATIKMHQLA